MDLEAGEEEEALIVAGEDLIKVEEEADLTEEEEEEGLTEVEEEEEVLTEVGTV